MCYAAIYFFRGHQLWRWGEYYGRWHGFGLDFESGAQTKKDRLRTMRVYVREADNI